MAEPLLGVKVFSESGEPMNNYYRFDGETFVPDLDAARLSKQIERVFSIMSSGEWYTLNELSTLCLAPESSVSARLRDLRKEKFGNYLIERRRITSGSWQYRLAGKLEKYEGQMSFLQKKG